MTETSPPAPLAVHFGAGNIGRGFLGQLYFESGFHTRFVDVDQAVIEALHQRQSYPLRIVEESQNHDILIESVDAIHASDTDKVGQAIAKARIVSTAVGAAVLPHIAKNIANGILLRHQTSGAPLDILVCENLADAGVHLQQLVRAHLPQDSHAYFDDAVGFVDASVGRMVPVMTKAQREEDPLLVCVEPYCELPVDGEAFKGEIPQIKHLLPKPGFKAYVARKLYVHNMSHAATAYLGHAKGYALIADAIRDPEIRTIVADAAWESCRALASHYKSDLNELDDHRNDLIHRYHNRALGDQIGRVARDPIRKLAPRDRLIGAGLLCHTEGIEAKHIAMAAAGAILYQDAGDPAACEIQSILEHRGIEGVLREICSLEPAAPLARLIARHYREWPWPLPQVAKT